MKNILLIDDSVVILMQLENHFQKVVPDVTIHKAKSGEEGLKVAESIKHIDLAVVDFNMNKMDGLETSKQLSKFMPASRIIICTANQQSIIKNNIESNGFLYMNKPLNKEKSDFLLSVLNSEAA